MMSRKGPSSFLSHGKKWSGTVTGDRGNTAMDLDTVRLLKTQDLGYVRTTRNVVTKEVAKLEQQLILMGQLDGNEEVEESEMDSDADAIAPLRGSTKPRKIVFVDNEEEQEKKLQEKSRSDFEEGDDEEESSDNAKDQRSVKRTKRGPSGIKHAKARRKLKRELESARKKLKVLTDAEQELEIQKAKMAKTATSGGVDRRGKKLMFRTRKR
jgi:U3 small nucleolar RNA-associated protein 11